MIEQHIEYEHAGTVLQAYAAHDGSACGPRPTVLVAHTWQGRGEFVCDKARILAGQGFTGIAIDLYGKGVEGSGPEESAALMQPFLDDRAFLRERLLTALSACAAHDEVDATKIAAIGYCFGGLCVLDLARAGADIRGIVSLHGLLGAPDAIANADIVAKVMVLNGNDDPMVSSDDIIALQQELSTAGVDWQLHNYGHTQHSFTNPEANNPEMGTVYNALADHRSWIATVNFLHEVLG